ncbi:ABC transporter ATP-binding protein [Brachybacterium sp. AOP42-B2-9]|uniref:ABC transporter ATP-binding protein n=1 Tax=Brachybacterium sp. AOP42-B2-9 TaxID=3457672 RepID=UPI004034CB94
MGANSAESPTASPEASEREESTLWVPPEHSPLTVVAHQVRMRYKVPRTDRTARKGLKGRLTRRRHMVSVSAVRGVDLTARQGEFIGIIGRNGSGKSTLLRMLAGVEPPTSGIVLTSARPQLLGVSAALIPDLTGAENIKLGFLAMGMSPQEAEERLKDAAELSALGGAVDLPMRTYSSGMSSRLKFAIAVMAEPKILMIDEALSTGDAAFAERSKKKMDHLLERAGTVFMVNHAPRAIENVCSRVIWLENGRVVMDGETKEVSKKYRTFTYFLAQEREEEAFAHLEECIRDGAEQRIAAQVTLAEPSAPERDNDPPELEPDPFGKIFEREMKAQSFPQTLPRRTGKRARSIPE